MTPRWERLDPENLPTDCGYYAYVTNEIEGEDGIVYVTCVYNGKSLIDSARDEVGFSPTHYMYLEPVPRFTEEDETERI